MVTVKDIYPSNMAVSEKRWKALGFTSAPFTLDGKIMPMPSEWTTRARVQTKDAGETVGTGQLIAPFFQAVPETTWLYKMLYQTEYDILYDAYMMTAIRNKEIYHDFTTIDSNTGTLLQYRTYTQNDFVAPLASVLSNERMYLNVTFTFVGLGGEGGQLAWGG